jgi:hypothetical protein
MYRVVSYRIVPDIEMSGCKGKVPPAPEEKKNTHMRVHVLEGHSIYSQVVSTPGSVVLTMYRWF